MSKLKKFEQHYTMEVRSLTIKGMEEEGTQFTCKHCKVPSFRIKGRYSSLDEAGKFSFNNTFDASNYRHKKKCERWPDADATEEPPITFDINSPPENWKADELTAYLLAKAGPAPELAQFVGAKRIDFMPSMYTVKCIFRQPSTRLLSNELEISSTVLYQFPHWRDLLQECLDEAEIEEQAKKLIEACVRTLEREEKMAAAKRPRGMFSRADERRAPSLANETLLRLLRDSSCQGEIDFWSLIDRISTHS